MLIITKNVPIPPKATRKKNSKYAALEHMEINDVIYTDGKKNTHLIYQQMRKRDFKVTQRKFEDGTFGLWRTG